MYIYILPGGMLETMSQNIQYVRVGNTKKVIVIILPTMTHHFLI